MGYGFCHQIAERSFSAGGLFFSVCSRDTGIYLGIAFAFLAAIFLYRRRPVLPADFPPFGVLIICILCIIPIAFDGVSSYLGFRETTNAIRYVSGFLIGMAVGTFLTPLLFALNKRGSYRERFLDTPLVAALYFALALTLAAAFYFGYPFLGVVAPLLVVMAFVAILCAINVLIMSLFKRFPIQRTRQVWVIILILAFILSLLEIAAMFSLKYIFLAFISG